MLHVQTDTCRFCQIKVESSSRSMLTRLGNIFQIVCMDCDILGLCSRSGPQEINGRLVLITHSFSQEDKLPRKIFPFSALSVFHYTHVQIDLVSVPSSLTSFSRSSFSLDLLAVSCLVFFTLFIFERKADTGWYNL